MVVTKYRLKISAYIEKLTAKPVLSVRLTVKAFNIGSCCQKNKYLYHSQFAWRISALIVRPEPPAADA